MYISVFRWSQRRQEIIFRRWEQKPLRVIVGKKNRCAMLSIVASFVAAKRSFSRRFAWSRRHTFSHLRNFDRSWSSLRCFWCWLSAIWAISGSCHQLLSRRWCVSCNLVNVKKKQICGIRSTVRIVWSSPVKFWMSATCRNTTVRVRGNCRCRQPWNNSRNRADKSVRYTRYLRNFDEPLGLAGRRRQCFWRRQRVISSKNDGAGLW